MRLTDYIIIFFVIFGCFTLLTFYSINTESAAGVANTEYANVLTAATHDAAKTIDMSKAGEQGVWDSETSRNKTLDTFYTTLRLGFNFEYTAKKDEVYIYTPVVCLIDNNGYYISYNSSFDDYGNAKRPVSSSNLDAKAWTDTTTVSSLNTWAKEYGEYGVRYFLDNTVEVTLPTGKVVQGKRDAVKSKMEALIRKGDVSRSSYETGRIYDGTNMYSIKDLLENKDEIFETEKTEVIVRKINEEVEYYINQQNVWAKELDIPYSFTMPEISGEDWHRLLANPTIISFLQGVQAKTKNGYINVYALAGGELTKEIQYYITEDYFGQKTYHCLEGSCPDHVIEYVRRENTQSVTRGTETEDVNQTFYYYTCDGEVLHHLYTSMAECAREGAVPCRCAINHN